MRKIIFLLILIPNLSFGGSINIIGEKGIASNVDRIIEVKMYDNYYEPKQFTIKKNENIKFVVHNLGEMVLEFNIATKTITLQRDTWSRFFFRSVVG